MLPPKKLQSLISNGFGDSIDKHDALERQNLLKNIQNRNNERKTETLEKSVTKISVLSENLIEVTFDDGVAGFIEFEKSFIESLPFKITCKQYMQLIHIVDGHLAWPCIPDFNTNEIYSEILRNGKVILTK